MSEDSAPTPHGASDDEPVRLSKQRPLRAADADRQAVVDRLNRAFEEGRLEFAEFDQRVQTAYQAKTYAELQPLTRDLPSPAQAAWTGAGDAGAPAEPGGGGGAGPGAGVGAGAGTGEWAGSAAAQAQRWWSDARTAVPALRSPWVLVPLIAFLLFVTWPFPILALLVYFVVRIGLRRSRRRGAWRHGEWHHHGWHHHGEGWHHHGWSGVREWNGPEWNHGGWGYSDDPSWGPPQDPMSQPPKTTSGAGH